MNAKRITCSLLLIVLCAQSYAQLQDSTNTTKWYRSPAFKAFALPAVLIGYGVLDNHHSFASHSTYGFVQRNYPGFHSHLDDYIEHTPTAAVYGLNMIGIKSENNFANRAMICLMAYVIKSTVTTNLKKYTHVLRPDSSDYYSFPSGHTANAFVGAEFMHQEYKDQSVWFSVAGYSVATATGALRMLNNKHWFSDVAAGAGIGILSTRTAYLIYPWIKRNICGNTMSNVMVLPTFGKGYGNVTCVWRVGR